MPCSATARRADPTAPTGCAACATTGSSAQRTTARFRASAITRRRPDDATSAATATTTATSSTANPASGAWPTRTHSGGLTVPTGTSAPRAPSASTGLAVTMTPAASAKSVGTAAAARSVDRLVPIRSTARRTPARRASAFTRSRASDARLTIHVWMWARSRPTTTVWPAYPAWTRRPGRPVRTAPRAAMGARVRTERAASRV